MPLSLAAFLSASAVVIAITVALIVRTEDESNDLLDE